MELLHPGVYIQEIPSGVRPIEGVSTSTTAFLGKAEKGPLDHAFMVTSFTEFQTVYGGFLGDSFLAHAALQFFNNGGRRLYIVRVAKNPTTADINLNDRKATPAKTLTIAASSAGAWGNELDVDITDGSRDPANEFRIAIRRGDLVLETFDDLSINSEAPNFAEKIVGAKSQLIRVTVEEGNNSTEAGSSVSDASPGTSLPAENRNLTINIDGDGAQTITLDGTLTTGAEIAAEIQTKVRALAPSRASTAPAAYSNFKADFSANLYILTSGSTGKRSSVEVSNAALNNAAAFLKLGRTNDGIETTGAAVLRPANGSYHVGDNASGGNVHAVTPGSDGETPQQVDYDASLHLLDPVRDVNLIAVPGIGTTSMVASGANYCEQRMDCFFIGDMDPTDDTKEEAKTFMTNLTKKSSYAAVYFPWLKATDPAGISADPISLPPSGYVAGMYAKIDAKRGVWKAPAGAEANLGGAVGLTTRLIDAEQDILNPIGVNVIRSFPATGIVIWGARTLATQSNPEYRYVPVRRTAIYLEQSIYNGIQWSVFEPNDADLHASLRLNINAFMLLQFRNGAFQGRTPNDAFFVKCDNQTTTQADIDAGIVNILVGFAPLKPAEFVVLKLTQQTGQPAV
ncbi:MAG TPA: phage tail sheath subtilisin-like domain-containing protein [Blastocatellia bacterium]|jgi:phage tail sheath protein FI|nr:phage tail sheath subtilisin-like domain-containing protein [Blastocatellia bacterium]